MIIAAGFPAKWILENYLVQYVGACSVLLMLFAAQVFLVIVKGIFVNLYKAKKIFDSNDYHDIYGVYF
ncbi:hypothetical protein E4K24_000359 [Enterococcus faecium]|nr:hypothetical protein [Enterococcus faecium]